MFEDFSFSSPSSRPTRLAIDSDDRLMVDCDSTMISPLSSRCPSPKSHRFRTLSRSRSSYFRSQQQPPTSVPFSYDSKRLSISTLTQKLHEHTLRSPIGDHTRGQRSHRLDGVPLSPCDGYVLTPPDTDHDEDGHSDSSPLLCSNPSPTSVPSDFLSLERVPTMLNQDHLTVRRQRQHISELQCDQGDIDAVRQTILDEDALVPDYAHVDDCHPSSLPPRSSPRRRTLTLHRSRFGPTDSVGEARGRRKSSSVAVQSHRIEKNHHSSLSGRDVSTRGDQGLRRKSMVTAALASVVERV